MQRMRLQAQGVKPPPLGSVQDRVYRQYMMKEAELDAKRAEFDMLLLLTNPQITEDASFRKWKNTVKKVWDQYIGLRLGIEVPDDGMTEDDKKLSEYYQKVVKLSKLQMYRDQSTGGLHLQGWHSVMQSPGDPD